MANSVLSADRFHNEEAAFAYVETRALAESSGLFPHCGNAEGARIGRLSGKTTPCGPAEAKVLRVPQAVHRAHRIGV